MEILRIENLSVSYDGKVILSDFSLVVRKGDKILIKGRSGIGKSTLFKLILGFSVQDFGNICFEGAPVDRSSVWQLRKRIAYVSQDTDVAEGRVSELIDGFFSFRANKDAIDRDKISEYLSMLSLPQKILDKQYMRLSGGEKQRITLLMALLSGKDIFLLDEVSAELDSELKQRVSDLFFDNPQWTVLAISHDKVWEYTDPVGPGAGSARSNIRIIDL